MKSSSREAAAGLKKPVPAKRRGASAEVVVPADDDLQTHGHHAHKSHKLRLNRLVGQLHAVGRMLDEGRYCPDILMQTRAASAALKALEDSILAGHMEHCVKNAFNAKDPGEGMKKIEELMMLFRKRI